MADREGRSEDPPQRASSSNQLSGTVVGPSVQAGSIHGDLHFHEGPATPVPVPRQLTAPSPYFVSRGAELSWLTALLHQSGSRLAVLSGPGGVGKTALAVQWAYQAQDRFPDGQLYVDLGGFSGDEPVDPREVLGGFLRALGVAAQRVPLALAEQAALYRSVTAGRSLLVVLDNAYSAAQARVLLPAPGASMVVVTSRNRLIGLMPDGARLLDVTPLPIDDAVTLLGQAVGESRVSRERDQATDLAAVCGGLPIALCVAAARLAARPRLSLRRVAVELSDEAGRLGGLSAVGGASVRAAFDVSYRQLDTWAAVLYRRLALHPGPEFGPGPVAAVLATIDEDTPADEPASGVELLLAANLLEEVTEDRFRFHDLLRLHARHRADSDDSQQDRTTARLAMLEWYLAAAARADGIVTPYRRRLPYAPVTALVNLPHLANRSEALTWLERERVNLITAGRTALAQGHSQLAWQLCDVMWPLFLYRKHFRDQLEVDARGVEAARAWGNTWAEADMLKRLGRACRIVANYPAAEQHIRAAIARFREAGDVRGRLDADEGLASLHRDQGHDAMAAQMYAQVLAGNRKLGNDRCTGITLINLGLLLPRLGRSEEAIGHLREARDLFAGLTEVDPFNGARVLVGLAVAYLGVGDLAAAGRAAAEAAERMQTLGSEYEYAEAQHLLGQVAERRDDAVAAEHHYRLALGIFTALGSPRASLVGRRLGQIDGGTAEPA
ncbi:MAG TPA: tetratricopeptide repeat protein [Micromonosporaceae bacterium]|nr:tetratricopeptide repeat protein [Micromonosporaceae bacterium]